MKYLFIFTLFFFSLMSCSDKINEDEPYLNNSVSQSNNKTNANDIPFTQPLPGSIVPNSNETSFNGISSSPSVIIRNGKVELILQEGILITGTGQKLKLVTNNQINGTLILKDAVKKTSINGITVASNQNVLFTPEAPLQPSLVYSLVFIENETKIEHNEKIYISAANYCNSLSFFSRVPIQSVPLGSAETINLNIRDNVFTDASLDKISVIGWDHLASKSFYFKINNRTNGAKYKIITAYGAYNIPGHECELYFQRDVTYPFPIWSDYNYGSKITKVTQEDTTFANPTTKKYYHFSKTFVILKVFDSSNVDITSNDNGVISLQQTDSLYGLPLSLNSEDESSLLAYLNRGNNNSYSMVLGGLVVGILAFFLSRRMMRKDNEDL